jgi:hypothetical protein
MEVSGQFWFQVPYPLGKGSSYSHRIGSWISFKAVLDAKKEITSLLVVKLAPFIAQPFTLLTDLSWLPIYFYIHVIATLQ